MCFELSVGARGESEGKSALEFRAVPLDRGNHGEPKRVAKVRIPEGAAELPVHSLDAPAPTVGGPMHPIMGLGGGLVMHTDQAVRRLLGVELWRLQGGS